VDERGKKRKVGVVKRRNAKGEVQVVEQENSVIHATAYTPSPSQV